MLAHIGLGSRRFLLRCSVRGLPQTSCRWLQLLLDSNRVSCCWCLFVYVSGLLSCCSVLSPFKHYSSSAKWYTSELSHRIRPTNTNDEDTVDHLSTDLSPTRDVMMLHMVPGLTTKRKRLTSRCRKSLGTCLRHLEVVSHLPAAGAVRGLEVGGNAA